MKKEPVTHTSQDHDRKHQHDHIESNPRAVKDIPTVEDSLTEDKRNTARHEHPHFTNRANGEGK